MKTKYYGKGSDFMQTERFNKLRKKLLAELFQKSDVVNVWRKIVKNQLRNSDLKDLFDHYDFNYNIEERAVTIRNEISNGTYKAEPPIIYRIEKKMGICRHLVIPQPSDALVFQVLVEKIADEILKNQPSPNAFYSRDKSSVSKPHEVDEYNLNWRQQWKKLQKQIYKFNEEKELIVVTDLSNYYDSININELRKVFSSYSKMDEVVIDLIFRIIEEISWKPDYLPYSFRGLPTTHIEGVRLLAHSFLFEIDEVIKQKTNNCFARWMDDITIGVDSKKQAIETLSSVSDMLKSRGLALNLAKTDIYTPDEGYFHFQIAENRYIDTIEKTLVTDPNYNKICTQLHKKFKEHLLNTQARYWDKVSKRYIFTYGKIHCTKLLPDIIETYIAYPNLRQALLVYLQQIGYTIKTSDIVLQIVKEIDIFDDISLYQLCYLITQWEIPINEHSKSFLKEFEASISSFSFKRKLPFDFYCLLWFKSKYSHPEELLSFIKKYTNLWQTDTFLRRQTTAILSRLLVSNKKDVEDILNSQISSGVSSTVTLATQILFFSNLNKLDSKLLYYLFPKTAPKYYPLSKFLVLCSVLNSEKIRNDNSVKNIILNYIKDPYYLKWLDAQFNVN